MFRRRLMEGLDNIPDDAIMTIASNPEVLAVCYAQGWCASKYYMTLSEAQAVTDIGTVFSYKTTITHFDEFEHFTNVTSIPSRGFIGMRNLSSIKLPVSIQTIGAYALQDLSSLTSLYIPKNVKNVGTWHTGLRSLSQIIVSSENNTYDSRDNCNAVISTKSNNLVFGCYNTIIPESVTSINYGVFWGATQLEIIDFPSTLTSIGDRAFNACVNLKTIICRATTAPSLVNSAFKDIKTGGTLYVPAGSTGYDVWMGTGNYYLGKYNWTKVEMQS